MNTNELSSASVAPELDGLALSGPGIQTRISRRVPRHGKTPKAGSELNPVAGSTSARVASNLHSSLAVRGMRPETIAHGRRARYVSGCRCELCTAANRNYARRRAKAQREGDWNGLVPADRARAHLLDLARQGVGRRTVAAVTDIADSVLHRIRQGRKQQIRARTEKLILAVTAECVADHAVVSSGRTQQLIERLLEEGFTKRALARRLGYRSPALQFGRRRMTARNVHRVEALYRSLTT